MFPAWLLPVVVSFVCWGLWAFVPKITTRYLDPRSAMVFEGVGGVVILLVVLFQIGFKPTWDPRGAGLAVITGLAGTAGALAYLFAVQRGPVALVATISALYPALTLLLSMVFLGETISLKQFVGILLGLCAMVLIAT